MVKKKISINKYTVVCRQHLSALTICPAGASGLVHFDEEGERNVDYSIYDMQHVGGVPKFVPILHFDSHNKDVR